MGVLLYTGHKCYAACLRHYYCWHYHYWARREERREREEKKSLCKNMCNACMECEGRLPQQEAGMNRTKDIRLNLNHRRKKVNVWKRQSKHVKGKWPGTEGWAFWCRCPAPNPPTRKCFCVQGVSTLTPCCQNVCDIGVQKGERQAAVVQVGKTTCNVQSF